MQQNTRPSVSPAAAIEDCNASTGQVAVPVPVRPTAGRWSARLWLALLRGTVTLALGHHGHIVQSEQRYQFRAPQRRRKPHQQQSMVTSADATVAVGLKSGV